MSSSNPCTCYGTLKERRKNWYVYQRNYNVSAFESPRGQRHYSDYSSIACSGDGGDYSSGGRGCLMQRRSKASFVDLLPERERE